MPKKIALISSIYTPYTRGGAETVVKNIVNGFKETNHEIFVITLSEWRGFKSLVPKIEYIENVKIYRFYALNLFSYLNIQKYKKQPILRLFWHFFDMFNLHSYWIIRHILKKEKPNVVMTHILKGIGYTTCRAVKSCKIKNIHTEHYVGLSIPSGIILKGKENIWQHTFFLTKFYQACNRWLLSSPDIVVSSSKFLLNFYTQRRFFKKSKKMVLTNPVDAVCHPHNSSDSNQINFLHLGQVEDYKGSYLLINVFKKIIKNNKNVNLIIAGTGSGLEQAKKMAEDYTQIQILGYVDHNKLDEIFYKTDALIIPSLCYENSPTIIFEALASGIPVIAARIGGIEFIQDNYNGFTFEAGDENDLQKVLEHVIKNKEQLANMRNNCLESVKNIGIKNYIQKLEELI
jgi:glycosyltransferase involved in cell wall biosynthesis